MARKRRKKIKIKNKAFRIISIILVIVLLVVSIIYKDQIKKFIDEKINGAVVLAEGEMSFHFMTLGNENTGDCTYIKAGDVDILIDAGSRANSVDDIQKYIDNYVSDGALEYVIVTHADRDHIAGFAASNSIFDLYECKMIIDFNNTNKDVNGETYSNYIKNRENEVKNGAKHYTALECYNNQNGAKRIYEFGNSMKMEILYNYYYENKSSDENNYSVCVLFTHGSKNFLFTGDLEESGEKKLVEYYGNKLPEVELYKAGHHGSPTSSNPELLQVIKPKKCVVCCCAGSVEYTDNLENTFPSQEFINNIAPYTKEVYVPIAINVKPGEGKNEYVNDGEYYLLHGDVIIRSKPDTADENGNIVVTPVIAVCENNDGVLLKDLDWFKNNRTTPTAWLN